MAELGLVDVRLPAVGHPSAVPVSAQVLEPEASQSGRDPTCPLDRTGSEKHEMILHSSTRAYIETATDWCLVGNEGMSPQWTFIWIDSLIPY